MTTRLWTVVLCGLAAGAPAAAGAQDGGETMTDHQRVVGRVGVGWYGVSDIPLAVATTTGNADVFELQPGAPETVAAPAVGVRLWLTSRIGIDGALGLHFSGGRAVSTTGESQTTTPQKRRFAFLLHGGVPLALATGRHATLLVTPELNVGYARSRFEPVTASGDAPPDAGLSGLRFDLGARAGLELQFGFIGVPELALEASVGMFLLYEWTQSSAGNRSVTTSATRISTSQVNDPWDIFRGNVAARYYF